MTLLISRMVLTVLLVYFVHLVWTKNVDLLSWGRTQAEKLLPITESKTPSFSVFASLGLDPVDTREYTDEEPKNWSKARLRYRVSLLTSTATWSDNAIVGVIFYSADRLYKTESEIPPWIAESVKFGEKPPHHRVLHHTVELGQINSAKPSTTKWFEADISINHTPWIAAVYVLAKNSPPQWYQLSIKHGNPQLQPLPGQGVQISSHSLVNVEKPIVSAGYEKLF